MLSSTSQSALRALAELAARPNGESVLAKELAEAAAVALPYLSKVLHQLVRVGVLASSRGTRGGYRLLRPPHEVTLVEIVTLFDGSPDNDACIFGAGRRCCDSQPCPAHPRWGEIRDALRHFLETTSLADIVDRR